ncbi:MAG TPA: ATP-binding cassette domain-containing protein [Candidatus Dormibacteraeota bacterium]|nr:ATP-binding cassette domain-containing protein [Candidatus Dormibacteraeota bacterium]
MSAVPAGRPNERLLVNVRRLTHVYRTPREELVALSDLNFQLVEPERVAIVGPSGSGKTTLLNILAGLETPPRGAVLVGGRDLATLTERERDEYRRTRVGYAMQRVELGVWSQLTVLENVLLPMLGVVPSERERRDRAGELLEAVGLGERTQRMPAQLGYGERRRLALAVALGNHPRLLLADEVTAGLDDEAGDRLLSDLSALLRRLGASAVIVAHGRHLPDHVDRIVPLPYPRPVPLERTQRRSQATRHGELVLPQNREVLVAESLSKRLPSPEGPVEVVRDASLRVRAGEMVAILGMSGVGKSTLLGLCAGLDEPDSGVVTLAGQRLTGLRGEAREALLQRSLGWVMGARPPTQVTPLESVALAARIGGASAPEASRLARVALAATGLEERGAAPMGQLSGGEQARVAVARALVRFPALIVADEPTAQLDILTSTDIIDLLRYAADSGIAVLLATTYPVLAEAADRVLVMREGTLRELRR